MGVAKGRQKGGADNPVTKYFRWKSGDKRFVYYDSSLKEEIEVKNFDLAIIDGSCKEVSGFNKGLDVFLQSNMVNDLMAQEFTVRYKDGRGTLLPGGSGLWKEIQRTVKANQGRLKEIFFCWDRKEKEIIRIDLEGAGRAGLFPAKNKANAPWDLSGYRMVWKGESFETVNGAIRYNSPVFILKDLTPGSYSDPEQKKKAQEIWDKIVELDNDQVGPYIEYRTGGKVFSSEDPGDPDYEKKTEQPSPPLEAVEEPVTMADDFDDDLPF